MRTRYLSVGLLIALASLSLETTAAQRVPVTGRSPIPDESRQMILVTTGSWTSSAGTLRRFERAVNGSRDWTSVGEPYPVVVGRSGLGWGIGLHVPRPRGPQKREGDGRAPAGVFHLTTAFGYDAEVNTGLPYIVSTPTTDCVDDSASRYYNEVLDGSKVNVDYTSHEQMRRADELYRVGVIVAHNGSGLHGTEGTTRPVIGGGSCIFLHVWSGPNSSTAGCTAMPEERLREILAWVDESATPVLVQLPRAEGMRLARPWGLPGPAW